MVCFNWDSWWALLGDEVKELGRMVFLSKLLAVMPKARIKGYTYEHICRGKDAIKDILPLTIMNIKLV